MESTPGVSRRKVVLAGVWTTPVVLAAIATPAAAASGLRTISLVSELEPVAPGETFLPITVQVSDNGGAVGQDEGVVFQVTSDNAAFEEGGPVQVTNTYEDGQATAFGLIAGATPGVVTVFVSSGSATTTISLEIAE
ncbi:hypothetical protein JOE31_001355 [Arthrobacter sp. PvP023]|uniref:hypothetical protein n=1 Tax=Micrococcaceae TaxID=1268 RepID=UPI001AE434BC|nr:hypothetical protein [Arthrobacter sp. PvP023]MBP1135123.1 hypothetical protein [Arthrobacter sp. PvP023]